MSVNLVEVHYVIDRTNNNILVHSVICNIYILVCLKPPVSGIAFIVFSRPYEQSRYWYTVPSVCLSVCRLSVTLCIVAKRCVLQQKLLLRAYRKSHMRNRLVPK